MLTYIIFFLTGACCAAIVFRAIYKSRENAFEKILSEKESACDALLSQKDDYNFKIIAEKETHYNTLLSEKEKIFSATITALKEQFANLAAETLKERSADLTALNKSQLEIALKPLKEQFTKLEEITRKAQSENENLSKSMTKDVDTIGQIARNLSGIASALASNTRIQGKKGEDILAEKLRQAGLEENISFFLQQGTENDRPDAQICDAENRWLVIDSKVSLCAYLEYEMAEDEADKAAKLSAHIASVKSKIDQLAKKKYPLSLAKEFPDRNYLPVTAMFVPYEAPLHIAIKEEPSLLQHAAENNIVIITPLTLLAYVRLVYLAWQHEKESRNQALIVDTARELRFSRFIT